MIKLLKTVGTTIGASVLILITLALAYIVVPVIIALVIIAVVFFVARDHFENDN